MSELRAEAIQMLNHFPEDKVPMVISYMKSIGLQMKEENKKDNRERMEAFKYLKNLRIKVPNDFDEKKELLEALDEKYGSAD